LQACESEGLAGGPVYDALIAACARKAGVRAILTLNPDHFRRVGATVELVVPGRR
jgi:predicted nucleic acid-binding protein